MRFVNIQTIVAGDIASNINGGAVDASLLFYASVQGVAAGSSPVGTIKLQGSNDHLAASNLVANTTPTNWSDIATVSVNAVGAFLIPKTGLCYQWIRAIYVATSGSGTISVNIQALGQ